MTTEDTLLLPRSRQPLEKGRHIGQKRPLQQGRSDH
jgi:hypothetical protein